MARFNWRGGHIYRDVKTSISGMTSHIRLWYLTHFYNLFTSWSTVIDTAIEPMFWFVDHIVKYIGPMFVIVIVVLVSCVLITFYVCLLPHKWQESAFWSVYHLIVGHWFLINTAFHYYRAAFTDPGTPPQHIPEVVSICKKCIAPKPPRSHHCSICDRCVLKMDHHCPWLNNCVGHYNHRHFFLFCVFMWIGSMYVCYCAFGVYNEHYLGDENPTAVALFSWGWFKRVYARITKTDPPVVDLSDPSYNPIKQQGFYSAPLRGYHVHTFVSYLFMMSTACAAAVGLLTLWHAKLISSGETSIEVHVNKKERVRLKEQGLVYQNPYDFGAKENWKIFLGLQNGRSFWRHIFFPSAHRPQGDGLTWANSITLDHQPP